MKMRFWGVRGSIPTPLTPEKLKSKISSVVQCITNDDLASQESRERFLARLPEYLFSTVGGNTSCVEVITNENCKIILDAGTGSAAGTGPNVSFGPHMAQGILHGNGRH